MTMSRLGAWTTGGGKGVGSLWAKARRLGPWPSILWGTVFLVGLALSWREVGNPDLGFQLNGARYLLEHGDVPRDEPFLYTVPWSRYVDLQWLWQVTIYGANQWAGLLGMNLLCLAYTLAASAVFLIRARAWCDGLGAVAAGLLLLLFMVNQWDFRPHTLSWVYLGLVLLCLEKFSGGDKRAGWFLPLLMVGWVNCHALFSLGLVTLGLWTLGELGEACLAKGEERRLGLKKVGRLIGLGVLSAFVCLINPYGWEGWIFPFRQLALLTNAHIIKSPVFGVSEFKTFWGAAINFSVYGRPTLPLSALLIWLLFILGVVGFGLRRPRWPGPVWMVGLAFTGLFLTAIKNWSYFAFAILPYAAAGLSQFFRFVPLPWKVAGRAGVVGLCLLLGLGMRSGWWSEVTTQMKYGLHYQPRAHPAGAVEVIRRAGSAVRIMNPHDLGGWLAWATGQQVYIDGRNDNYPERLYREFAATGLPENFKALIEVIRANVVVARVMGEGVWIETLAKDPDWRLVERADGVMVFFQKDLAPEIGPWLGQASRGQIPPDEEKWAACIRQELEKPLAGWKNVGPFFRLGVDQESVQESAGSILLGKPLEAEAYAWRGICGSPHFMAELWVNLALAFEAERKFGLADQCWDALLRKVPQKDLQERAHTSRMRRQVPASQPNFKEKDGQGWH